MAKHTRSYLLKNLWQIALATSIAILPAASVPADVNSVDSRLRSDPNLSLFTKAMDVAYYWERLSRHNSFTLFVPTDDAMAIEGSEFLLKSVLMTDENRQRLETLVSAHIVAGMVDTHFTERKVLLPTLSGDCLLMVRNGNKITLGPDARVLSDELVKGVRILTVNKLLIPDYQASPDCVAIQSIAQDD